MAENRQAEGRLGHEDVAGGDFEGRAGGVVTSLVVARDDHALAGMFEQDLRAAEDMACGNVGRIDPARQADGLAIFDWRGAVRSRVAQLHDRQRLGGGDGLAVPAARVVGMAVRHQRLVDRAAGIDPAVGGHDMDAVRFGADPGKGRSHRRTNGRAARRFPYSLRYLANQASTAAPLAACWLGLIVRSLWLAPGVTTSAVSTPSTLSAP